MDTWLRYVDRFDAELGEIDWLLNKSPRALEWQQVYEYEYGTPAHLMHGDWDKRREQ